jgi:diacylglycerol kinase (ATP)
VSGPREGIRAGEPPDERGTLVILNPSAGGGSDGAQVEAWAALRGGTRVRTTAAPGDASRWARQAADEGVGLVVAAGGDGTVHQVAAGLLAGPARSVALGVLPLGTGNDLARTLGIPLKLIPALHTLDAGYRRDMDVARVTPDEGDPRFLLNALTGGFSGELHDDMDAATKSTWGPLSYLRCGIELWGEHTVWPLTVEVGEERVEVEALNLVVANGATAGGGLPVAPGADPFDGMLEVVLILEAPASTLSALAAGFVTGDPGPSEALVRLQGTGVTIRSPRPLPLSLDGERLEASALRVELVPGRLPVVVGEGG